MKMRTFGIWVLVLGFLAGCGKEHDHADHDGGHHHHAHTAPHGGSLVMLGNHEAQLEFVVDSENKLLVMYVLDGHAEHFLRIPQESVELEISYEGAKETVTLMAIGNAATGETVGDTSQFQSKVSWAFDGVKFGARLKEIAVRGTTYSEEAFSFPEGRH
ncbi:MAG: hypothetical protein AAGB46_03260 [Verrucomicrobiota bacterium]